MDHSGMTIEEMRAALFNKRLLIDGYDEGYVSGLFPSPTLYSDYLCLETDGVHGGFPLKRKYVEELCAKGSTTRKIEGSGVTATYQLVWQPTRQLFLNFQ